MLWRWGIILQAVDTNARGGALYFRGGALCIQRWIPSLDVGHYAAEVAFVHWRMRVKQLQDSGGMWNYNCAMFYG